MKKFTNADFRSVMTSAWRFFRTGKVANFAQALRMAWANLKALAVAKANVSEETHTWSAWKALGYEVAHESKALFQISVLDPKTKSGTRILSYFGASQVAPVVA